MKRKIILLLMTSMILGLIFTGCAEKEEAREERPNTEATDEDETDEDEIETDIIVVTDADQADAEEADVDQADVDQADTDQADTDQADVDQADTDQAETDQAETDQADADAEEEVDTDESDGEEIDVEEPDTEETDTEDAGTEGMSLDEVDAEFNAELDIQLQIVDNLGNWLKYKVANLDYEGFESNLYSLSYYSDTDLNDMVLYFHMLLSDTANFSGGMFVPEMGWGEGASFAGTIEGMKTVVLLYDEEDGVSVAVSCTPQ